MKVDPEPVSSGMDPEPLSPSSSAVGSALRPADTEKVKVVKMFLTAFGEVHIVKNTKKTGSF